MLFHVLSYFPRPTSCRNPRVGGWADVRGLEVVACQSASARRCTEALRFDRHGVVRVSITQIDDTSV